MLKNVVNRLLVVSLLILTPIAVFAQDCTTPGIGGGASSGGGGTAYSEGCSSATCVSIHNGKYVGVRFQIYEYSGGSADNIKMIGKGVDVWATNELKEPDKFFFSSPSTPNLQIKSKCTTPGNTFYPTTIQGNHTLSFAEYSSGKYGQVKVDTSLTERYKKHTINTWAFVHDGNKPISGWISENLLKKLIDGSPTKLAEVKSLFGMTDAEMTRIRTNPKNIYITAEILYRFWKNHTDYWYLGTVSESGSVHGYGALHNALYISASHDPDVGKIVPNYIKKTEPTTVGFMGIGSGVGAEAACNVARGYAVWNLEMVCWECGDSCETACQYAQKGTQERAACAVSYCSTKEPNNTSCFKTCTTVPDDVGCDPDTEKKCSDYKNKPVKKSDNCKNLESTDTEGFSTSISAKMCYDEKSDYGDGNDVEYSLGTQTYSNTIYYKIDCTEKMEISGLPYQPQSIYLTDNTPGNFHFSYKVLYNRTCELFYKTSLAYRKTHPNTYWIKVNNDSECATKCKLDEDRKALEDAVPKAEALLAEYQAALALNPTDEKLIQNVRVQEGTIDFINNVMIPNLDKTRTNAKERFKNISNESTPEELTINELKLRTYKYDKISEYEDTPLDMIPIVCTPTNTETEKKERFLCMLNGMDGEGIRTIKIHGIDYECVGTGGVVEGTGSTVTYEEVVVYSVPDSYVSTQVNSAGKIYHYEDQCDDATKGANGFCKIIAFGYTFPAFDGKDLQDYIDQVNSVPDKLTLSIQGGLCDELAYDFTCDYKVEDQYCTGCDAYPVGSDAYIACYEENCSCDAYCGSDVVCRYRYCPKLCKGCNWKEVEESCTNCTSKCSDYVVNSKEYITCFYDECCTSQCDGNCGCTYSCCATKCDELYSSNATKLKECKTECTKDLQSCKGGNDYLYRNISLHNPFPDRGTATGNIGNNWYNKEKYITNTDEDGYKDSTDGFSEEYEYYIKIDSKQLKEVKKMIEENGVDEEGNKDSTMYKAFGKSNSYISKRDSRAYCSKFLHEDLSRTGATVKVNYESSTNCKSIGG